MSIGGPEKRNYNSKLICFNPGGQSRMVNFTQQQVRHTGRSKSLQGFLDLLETERTSRRLLWPSKHFLFGFSIPYIFTYTFQTKSIDKCRSIFHTSGQIAINNLKKAGNSDGTPSFTITTNLVVTLQNFLCPHMGSGDQKSRPTTAIQLGSTQVCKVFNQLNFGVKLLYLFISIERIYM